MSVGHSNDHLQLLFHSDAGLTESFWLHVANCPGWRQTTGCVQVCPTVSYRGIRDISFLLAMAQAEAEKPADSQSPAQNSLLSLPSTFHWPKQVNGPIQYQGGEKIYSAQSSRTITSHGKECSSIIVTHEGNKELGPRTTSTIQTETIWELTEVIQIYSDKNLD